MDNAIIDCLSSDLVNILYKQYTRDENKTKIDEVSNDITKIFINKIKPYFLFIAILLLVLTVMNFVQFYYYLRMFILYSKENTIKTVFV